MLFLINPVPGRSPSVRVREGALSVQRNVFRFASGQDHGCANHISEGSGRSHRHCHGNFGGLCVVCIARLARGFVDRSMDKKCDAFGFSRSGLINIQLIPVSRVFPTNFHDYNFCTPCVCFVMAGGARSHRRGFFGMHEKQVRRN